MHIKLIFITTFPFVNRESKQPINRIRQPSELVLEFGLQLGGRKALESGIMSCPPPSAFEHQVSHFVL